MGDDKGAELKGNWGIKDWEGTLEGGIPTLLIFLPIARTSALEIRILTLSKPTKPQ
jgi:hypothetical protein